MNAGVSEGAYESVYVALAQAGISDRQLVAWAIAQYRAEFPDKDASFKTLVEYCKRACQKALADIQAEQTKPSKFFFEAGLDEMEQVYTNIERALPLAIRDFRAERREMEERMAVQRLVARLDMAIDQAWALGRSIVAVIDRMEDFKSCFGKDDNNNGTN